MGQFTGIEVLATIPLWQWVLLFTLLISQAFWIFNDAKKRGYGRIAWVWGAYGLLNVPSSLIVYLLIVNAREREAGGNGKNARGGPKTRPQ